MPFSVPSTQTPKNSEEAVPTVMTQILMTTQPTLSVPTSSKDSVRRVKSVFTLTIWPSTETKKSICMLIKEPNSSWTPSEANNSPPFLKKILEKFLAKNNKKWWKAPDPKSSASSSFRLLKKISMDGNGIAPMGKLVNTSIASLQDTCSKKMKTEKQRFKWIKYRLRRRSMLKDTNWWVKTKAVIFTYILRSFGDFWSVHEMEGGEKN